MEAWEIEALEKLRKVQHVERPRVEMPAPPPPPVPVPVVVPLVPVVVITL